MKSPYKSKSEMKRVEALKKAGAARPPREWKCWYSPEEKTLKAGSNYGCTDGWEWVHVIEHSAYESVNEQLKKANEWAYSLEAEVDRLQTRLELLAEEDYVRKTSGQERIAALEAEVARLQDTQRVKHLQAAEAERDELKAEVERLKLLVESYRAKLAKLVERFYYKQVNKEFQEQGRQFDICADEMFNDAIEEAREALRGGGEHE